jgi:hypothetical protein
MHLRSRFIAPRTCLLILIWSTAPAIGAETTMARWVAINTSTLTDGKTGLQWTRQDSGLELDWHAAKRHCEDRREGWRLPTLPELEAIYDANVNGTPCGKDLCHIAPQFDLSGAWFWSATSVGVDGSDGPELTWGMLMVNGARTPSVREVSYGARALCVRKQS